MAPKPLEVKIEVILDDKDKKFYPGDEVDGKIFFTSNQFYSVKNLRLAWTGRIHVQPIQSNKDFQIYFDECWKLGPTIKKAKNKTLKGASQVPYYHTELVSITDHDSPEPRVELSKNTTVGFSFKVHVPNDRPLPSSTNGKSNNKIIYLLEAFIAQETRGEKPTIFGQRVVPVLEAIYTRTEEMTKPQRAEQVFTVLLSNQNAESKSALRVTLPCRGCQTGVAIPVSISIWNDMEFSRKQGISISLYRVNQIKANGRDYTSPGENVHRVVSDLDIKYDENDSNVLMQTIRTALPIPKGTTPTITLDKSGLLSIAYYIRVQVFAQEGVYITPDGVKSQFMLVDIPFVVGTLATPPEKPRSTHTTPISSPKSFNGTIVSPTTSFIYTELSPRLSNTSAVSTLTNGYVDSRNSFSLNSNPTPLISSYYNAEVPRLSSSTINGNSATSNGRANQILSSTPITSPALTNKSTSAQNIDNDSVTSGGNSDGGTTSATLIDSNNKKSSRMIGGMFRKSSSGSNVSLENGKKKKSVFSSFKIYSRSSNTSKTVEVEDSNSQGSLSPATDKNMAENRKEDQQKEAIQTTEDQATLSPPNEGGGVFDIFSGDTDSFEESTQIVEKEKDQQDSSMTAQKVGNVFKMFPDDDDDEEEEMKETSKVTNDTHCGVFKMFPDDDDDEEEERVTSTEYPLLGDGGNLNSITANIEHPLTHGNDSVTNQRILTSHVFKMFDDSTDDEEEKTDVQNLSISEPEYKPNQKEADEEVYDKPNAIEDNNYNIITSNDISSDEEEFDLLSILARKEKLQRKIA